MSYSLESIAGWLLFSVRGHDAKLLTRSAPFQNTPDPSIDVSSPTCPGETPVLHVDHTQLGKNTFPALSWTTPSGIAVAEYAVVVEDPDAPLPSPVVHGVYIGIPASKTTLTNADFERVDEHSHALKGGFEFGLNRRRTIWSGPRPVLAHGVHRYVFQVIALDAPLGLAGEAADKSAVELAMDAKVVAWGQWIGTFERKVE